MNIYNPNHIHLKIKYTVGQKIVVFNPESQILFLKRSAKCSRAGGWDFPGGGLDTEDPLEGIKREVMEETGLTLDKVELISSIAHEREVATERNLFLGYIGFLSAGEEVHLSWEHDDYGWLSIEEAQNVELPAGHKKFLEAAISRVKK